MRAAADSTSAAASLGAAERGGPLSPPLAGLWVNLQAPYPPGGLLKGNQGGRERERGRKRRGARPSIEAQFTMILLTFSTGRRLDFVHHSGVFYLQTLLWILCATVCGTEQYFNVEVRVRGLSSFPLAWAAP